jgi:hypothetical protein
MRDFCCGRIGIDEDVFWKMTARQSIWKMDVYRINNERQWEQTRFIASILINTNSKTKVKPTDIVPLSIDGEKKQRTISEQEKELIRKNWLKK